MLLCVHESWPAVHHSAQTILHAATQLEDAKLHLIWQWEPSSLSCALEWCTNCLYQRECGGPFHLAWSCSRPCGPLGASAVWPPEADPEVQWLQPLESGFCERPVGTQKRQFAFIWHLSFRPGSSLRGWRNALKHSSRVHKQPWVALLQLSNVPALSVLRLPTQSPWGRTRCSPRPYDAGLSLA